MVLPLLGSFLGSALLPGMFGASAALSPLAAGAIGSGIGSLLQGDDLDEAIGTGLTSYFGGKLLGGFGKELGCAGGTGTPIAKDAKGFELLKGSLNPSMQGYNAPNLGEGAKSALQNTFNTGIDLAKQNPFTTAGVIGGTMLGDASKQQESSPRAPFKPRETIPIQQNIQQPPPGYRPGVDPQFNYGFRNPSAAELQTQYLNQGGMADYVNPTMLSKGGIATFAEGGDVPEEPNEKQVLVNAVNAIKGNMPLEQASIALATYQKAYGEEALEALIDDVKAGNYDNVGGKMDGQIPGGGDGMSDSVPATIDGQRDLLASKDEYMIDAPTVAMIGNGSSDAGAKKLDNFRKKIREEATGSPEQPKQIDAENIMRTALS